MSYQCVHTGLIGRSCPTHELASVRKQLHDISARQASNNTDKWEAGHRRACLDTDLVSRDSAVRAEGL